MAWTDFKFTPEDGLDNTTTFPSKPTSGAAARTQFMIILNQIKAFLNGTVKNTIDEHKAEYATNAIKKDGSVAMTSSLNFASATGIATLTENADSFLDLDCLGLTTARAYIRAFRNTNTTGLKRIDIHNGDGTSGIKIQILNGEINALNGVYIKVTAGNVSPEGIVSAPIGSLYLRSDVGELYVKKSGTGNTGWGKVTVV